MNGGVHAKNRSISFLGSSFWSE